MSDNDRDYFQKRAEAELELAGRSLNAAAVKSHYTLAGYYLDRIYSKEAPDRVERS